MLRIIGWFIKAALFSVLVLIVANWARWDGRTISDQVRTGMAHAESSPIGAYVRSFGGAPSGNRRAPRPIRAVAQSDDNGRADDRDSPSAGEILSSERQKLQALIRELNSSHGRD